MYPDFVCAAKRGEPNQEELDRRAREIQPPTRWEERDTKWLKRREPDILRILNLDSTERLPNEEQLLDNARKTIDFETFLRDPERYRADTLAEWRKNRVFAAVCSPARWNANFRAAESRWAWDFNLHREIWVHEGALETLWQWYNYGTPKDLKNPGPRLSDDEFARYKQRREVCGFYRSFSMPEKISLRTLAYFEWLALFQCGNETQVDIGEAYGRVPEAISKGIHVAKKLAGLKYLRPAYSNKPKCGVFPSPHLRG